MSLQLKARCEELKLDWSTLSLENLLKEKQALKNQISEKQKHCLELQVESPALESSWAMGQKRSVVNLKDKDVDKF